MESALCDKNIFVSWGNRIEFFFIFRYTKKISVVKNHRKVEEIWKKELL